MQKYYEMEKKAKELLKELIGQGYEKVEAIRITKEKILKRN